MVNSDTERSALTYASVAPKAQREILIHAVLAGLTPLIPLPFLDDWARHGIQIRMTRRIATVHKLSLDDAALRTLGTETGSDEPLILSVAKKLAFFPIRRVLRTALFFLIVKDIVEVASRTYHVGYLMDHVMTHGWQATEPTERVRAAIDDVCRSADTSPVRRVFSSVFKESRELIGAAVQSLRGMKKDEDRSAEAGRPSEVDALVDRLQRAFDVMPPDHFVSLRRELEKALGVSSV